MVDWSQARWFCLHFDRVLAGFCYGIWFTILGLHIYATIPHTWDKQGIYLQNFNTLASGWFEDSRAKTTGSHVTLRIRNSGAISGRELFKASKDMASLLVCTQKIFFGWGCGFFESDVISGALLDHLGQLHLVLKANRQTVVFRWSFY